jgi:molecular chaperone GrpE
MENTQPNAPYGAKGAEADASDKDSGTAETEQLLEKLAAAEAAVAEMRDVTLRERAELENQRRRMQRDLDQARRFANERLLSDLLPVCDSLERGLDIEHAGSAALREGMDLTLKTLTKVLESNGMKTIDPTGDKFDPERHQAMSLVDSPTHPSGTVVNTLQKGYVLNDRLVRPALVVVAN